jgi:hypothetical protein
METLQQTLAIAKFCGWKYGKDHQWRHKDEQHPRTFPPTYVHCLNAMHEAEKLLNDTQKVNYSLYLTPAYDSKEDTMEIFASAPRRAEAFLKTIKKWKPADEL